MDKDLEQNSHTEKKMAEQKGNLKLVKSRQCKSRFGIHNSTSLDVCQLLEASNSRPLLSIEHLTKQLENYIQY